MQSGNYGDSFDLSMPKTASHVFLSNESQQIIKPEIRVNE